MSHTVPIRDWPKDDLVAELLHYQQLAALTLPRKERLPHLPHIDYFAGVEPYKGCVGGDYLAVIDFDEDNLAERIREAEAAGHPSWQTGSRRVWTPSASWSPTCPATC